MGRVTKKGRLASEGYLEMPSLDIHGSERKRPSVLCHAGATLTGSQCDIEVLRIGLLHFLPYSV
jgi:hypothetical protein